MTNAQKWIAAFLGLFLVLFMLSKVTEKEDDYYEEFENYSAQNEKPAEDLDGLTLFNRIGCANCHGADLKGSRLAPSLVSSKNYWEKEELINYLKNPKSFGEIERIKEYKSQYNSVMPPYKNVDEKDLEKIADYILTLEE